MDRRRFLAVGAMGLGAVAIGVPLRMLWRPSFSWVPDATTFVAGGCTKFPQELTVGLNRYSDLTDGKIKQWNPARGISKELDVPLFGHGFAFNRSRSGDVVAVTSQKWGTEAVAVNLTRNQILAEITAPKERVFFGHGTFVKDGRYLVMSAQAEDVHGRLLVYETDHWTFQHEITLPRIVHEVAHYAQGSSEKTDQLLAAYSEHRLDSNLYQEMQSGLLQIFDFDHEKGLDVFPVMEGSHILPLTSGNYAIGGLIGKKSPIALSLVNVFNKVRLDITDAQNFVPHLHVGEALSLAMLDPEHVVVTAPQARRVIVWQLTNNSLIDIRTEAEPCGVLALGPEKFVVNFLNDEIKSYRFDQKRQMLTLEEGARFSNGTPLYSG